MTLRINSIPSSFVRSRLKFTQDKGSGEAKLHVGPLSSESDYDAFFEFGTGVEYRFEKNNLLEYLHQVKLEYIYQSIFNYKDVDVIYWNEMFTKINGMSSNDFLCTLTKFTDRTRYYIRAEEDVFMNVFRGIALPRLTNVILEKQTLSSGVEEVLLKLEINEDYPSRDSKVNFITNFESKFERNRIIFGAPGTGKSYYINEEKQKLLSSGGDFERVTFHSDYSYANFVGTYKPVPFKKRNGEESISYEYVPGPFMRMYVEALKNSRTNNIKPYLLIVEEINRANAATVFGEVFQLLDRDENNVSEYSIEPSEDVKKYLSDELGVCIEDITSLRIPDNMFIWATMNSADQGVFPLDTAFKRRWDFEYLDTDNEEMEIAGTYVLLGSGESERMVEWNALRKEINRALSDLKINEDKLLGTFFVNKHIVVPSEGDKINAKTFKKVFKNKVLMYLFEDAAKQKTSSLFSGCENTTRYSYICKDFDEYGIEIFGEEFSRKFPKESDGGNPENGDEESSEGSE